MKNELWDLQARFTDRVIKALDKDLKSLTIEDKVRWTKEYLLCITKEGMEALDELNWKVHTHDDKGIVVKNVHIELIDMQKYLWGLMHIWEMTYSDFSETFKDKSYEVERKWAQNFEVVNVNDNDKNCIIDIDGVLNYYPECFYEWALTYKGVTREQLNNRVVYEDMKSAYRSSGIKRTLSVNKDSVNALRELKDRGYSIILATDRPYQEYKNIIFDTLYWLDANNIPYDYIFWSRGKKLVDVMTHVNKVAFIIDDKLDIAEDFNNLGAKSYLYTNQYNIDYPHKIKSIFEIEELR